MANKTPEEILSENLIIKSDYPEHIYHQMVKALKVHARQQRSGLLHTIASHEGWGKNKIEEITNYLSHTFYPTDIKTQQ